MVPLTLGGEQLRGVRDMVPGGGDLGQDEVGSGIHACVKVDRNPGRW